MTVEPRLRPTGGKCLVFLYPNVGNDSNVRASRPLHCYGQCHNGLRASCTTKIWLRGVTERAEQVSKRTPMIS